MKVLRNIFVTILAVLLLPFYLLSVMGMVVLGAFIGIYLAFVKPLTIIKSAWDGTFKWKDLLGDLEDGKL